MGSSLKTQSAALAILLLALAPLSAKESQPTLDVRTANSQTTFHIGERIPLKLTFTSPNDTEYKIAPCCPEQHDRGGEFDFESFEVSPSSGWADPLLTYLARERSVDGHGAPWRPLLASKPVEVSLDLNHYVRFDQPGVYRVEVVSRRVGNINLSRLRSNALELQIIRATPEWQNAALTAITAKLSRGPAAGQLYQDAVSDLRYLNTPAAIEEMTGELRKGFDYAAQECSMGLLGLPDSLREVAIASMNRRIDEPDFPISALFFSTMSFLHVTTGSTTESIRRQRQSFYPVLWQTVFSSIAKKTSIARAETVQTLLEYGRNSNTPELKSRMASLLSSSLLDLDSRSQVDDLRQHWDLLRSPDILPALQTLAKLPPTNDGIAPYSREDLKSVAFRRWYELDPAGARREILTQIGAANPALSAQALYFLPSEQLPQFESLWAQAFVQATDEQLGDRLGSLLVKFGTGAATPQMIVKLNEPPRSYACMAHAPALAYLVRFSPDDARPLLKRAIASGEIGCNDSLFRWISEYATAPVLNEAAVNALNDPNPAIFGDALEYLRLYGTQSDQKPLWHHYVKWTKAWSGKAYILDHPGPGLHTCGDDCTGGALGWALLANQGWIADQALISRVLERCIGKEMCKNLNDLARSAAPPYLVTLPDASNPLGLNGLGSYNLAQYSPMSRDLLAAKIRQYPPGTKFVISRVGPVSEEQRKLEDEIQVIFEKNGMSLEKPAS
jgi:hypothetical protein